MNQLLSLLLLLSCLISLVLCQSRYDVLKEDWCGDSNCYDILGVKQIDDFRTIKVTYNNISMVLHPDKNPNATDEEKARYVRVNKAYEILSNPDLRNKYDEYLRLKSSMDSPREHPIVVLIGLYIVIVFVVLQYQKQRHNRMRKSILELPAVQQWLQRNKKIDINLKKQKKVQRSRSKRSLKNKKKGSQSDLNSESSLGDGEEDNTTKSWMDNVTDNTIQEALNGLNTIVPGWNAEAPSMGQAARDVPLFMISKVGDGVFYLRWYIQYSILGQECIESDREEMCRRHFKKSFDEWDNMSSAEKSKLMTRPGPWKVNKNNKKKRN